MLSYVYGHEVAGSNDQYLKRFDQMIEIIQGLGIFGSYAVVRSRLPFTGLVFTLKFTVYRIISLG